MLVRDVPFIRINTNRDRNSRFKQSAIIWWSDVGLRLSHGDSRSWTVGAQVICFFRWRVGPSVDVLSTAMTKTILEKTTVDCGRIVRHSLGSFNKTPLGFLEVDNIPNGGQVLGKRWLVNDIGCGRINTYIGLDVFVLQREKCLDDSICRYITSPLAWR